ncbi:MAG TPA: sigma 54-interacting transcriptional regulator [Gemmatimonadales bacterium]|nr:sigma 54-interacting transcriptional regulator [Gemmatimonadales bacterium]
MTAPGDILLLVVRLSDSFSDFWPVLARELGVSFAEWTPSTEEVPPPGVGVVLIAAGGHETQIGTVIPHLAVPSDIPVIVVGSSVSHRLAAQAVAAGASDYFALPDDRDGLRDALAAAVQRRRAALGRTALAHLEAQAHAFREIVGESPALKALLERAARVMPHGDATILITGETGTGKELLARALHYGSPRAAAPFVELNCAALPPQLLESELFGHERGAFTDAKTAKPGLFEVAQGGTLFLDEIDHLAPELQGKLLRALEQKSVRRLGATASRTVNVRIVAATNADLAVAVQDGRFREDLYYRLNVVTLELPPLRERGEDVMLLAECFLTKFSTQYGLPQPAVTPEVRRALLAHAWPGNIRELRNTVERAVLLSPPGTFALAELERRPPRATAASGGTLPFPAPLADIQRAAARAMLEATGGNRSAAARRLGISRSRLQRLLEEGGAPEVSEDDTDADTN